MARIYIHPFVGSVDLLRGYRLDPSATVMVGVAASLVFPPAPTVYDETGGGSIGAQGGALDALVGADAGGCAIGAQGGAVDALVGADSGGARLGILGGGADSVILVDLGGGSVSVAGGSADSAIFTETATGVIGVTGGAVDVLDSGPVGVDSRGHRIHVLRWMADEEDTETVSDAARIRVMVRRRRESEWELLQ